MNFYAGTKTIKRTEHEGRIVAPYIPNAPLVEAVRVAQRLERPLLLKGEPGCGKTKLAAAVAHELSMPYFVWSVKSTSRARDGLYTYDNVGRLRDAALLNANAGARPRRDGEAESYVTYGPLGKAFRSPARAVVLIDEIDKADIDFPNDLLLELDEQRFLVEETGQEIPAVHTPLVIITSNDERDLPDAFLRRCVFHYVEFPEDRLKEIVRAHLPDPSNTILDAALVRFKKLRAQMSAVKGEGRKLVGTSELIDWVRILSDHAEDEVLRWLGGKLPYDGVLLKNWEDHLRFLHAPEASASPDSRT